MSPALSAGTGVAEPKEKFFILDNRALVYLSLVGEAPSGPQGTQLHNLNMSELHILIG